MKSLTIARLVVVCGLAATTALPSAQAPHDEQSRSRLPRCRFAPSWSQNDVVKNPSGFEWDLLFWEGKFHQNDVAYNIANGMTYDGAQLDWITGDRTKKHPFSAASKEVSSKLRLYHCRVELSLKTDHWFEKLEKKVNPNYALYARNCGIKRGGTLSHPT